MDVEKVFEKFGYFMDKSGSALLTMFFFFVLLPIGILFNVDNITIELLADLEDYLNNLFKSSRFFRYFCLVLASPFMLIGVIIFSPFYGFYLLLDFLKKEEED